MSDERKKEDSLDVKAVLNRVFKREAATIITVGIIAIAGYAWAQKLATERVEDITDAKVRPLKKQVEELSAELREVKAQINANEARAAERFDVLYRAMFTGRRDSRADELATPAPQAPKDGGP